jgi:hypothetical protein
MTSFFDTHDIIPCTKTTERLEAFALGAREGAHLQENVQRRLH